MNSFTLFALIFAFGAVEMTKEVKLQAKITIKCGDRSAVLTENAVAPKGKCQDGLKMSDITVVEEKGQIKKLKTVYTPAPNEGGNQVLNAVVTDDNGDVLEHKDVYPSLDKLKACGGKRPVLEAIITGTLISKGKKTDCIGSAVIIAQ